MRRVTITLLITLLALTAPSWAQPQQYSTLATVFQRIAGAANSGTRYRLGVQQSSEINAYATPDGQVVFYTGLLEALPDENALAFVMAHEISHIELGHANKSQVAEGILGTALGLLVGRQAPLVQTGAALAYKGMTSGYSRAMESEADIAAMSLMDKAGYDPAGALQTLQLFVQMEGRGGGGLFATHPGARDRIKDVSAWIEKNRMPLTADRILAVPRPWPIVSEVIGVGRQLSQRVRALPPQAGDAIARQTLDQANEALAAYEQRPADPAALANLKEGLTSAQTFGLLSTSLNADPNLARDIQLWGQKAAQAEANQTLDQAARTRQFAVYMADHLNRNRSLNPQAVASLTRVAQAAVAYETALKSNAPTPAVQSALTALLSAAQDWDRQRSLLGLDPKVYGGLLTGLNNELTSVAVLEGRGAVEPGPAAVRR